MKTVVKDITMWVCVGGLGGMCLKLVLLQGLSVPFSAFNRAYIRAYQGLYQGLSVPVPKVGQAGGRLQQAYTKFSSKIKRFFDVCGLKKGYKDNKEMLSW